ncbi:MAG: hypothetical protein SFU83_20755 [Meiothermus sp.]|nr:hypothetical protein [Meiothermus sp.]
MVNTQPTTAQALNALSEMTTTEANQLPEGLTFIQLRNLLEAVEAAEYVLSKLRRATEQHIGWLEEAGEETPPTLELTLLPDYRPAA